MPVNALATEEPTEVESTSETTSSPVPDSSGIAEEAPPESGGDESTPPPENPASEADDTSGSAPTDSTAEPELPDSQPDSQPTDSQPTDDADSSVAPEEDPAVDSEDKPEDTSTLPSEEDPDAEDDEEEAPAVEPEEDPEEDPDEEAPPVNLEAIPGLSGGGYGAGGNERFMVPISAPVSGSTPIATAADLRKIGKEYPMNGNYHLTADINLAGQEWVPIGSGDNYFMGTLDGQGHVIKNMTITSAEGNIGLIGQTIRRYGTADKVALKNIGLENVNINVTKGGNIGALLADNARGHVTISNCYVTGSIKGTGTSVYAGGLVGTSIGYNPGGLLNISNCYSAAEITATGTTFDGILEYSPITVMGKAFAGGIVARAHDAENITNCHNIGKITTTSTGVSMAGGVAAILSSGTISTCSNTAMVSATSSFATNDSDNMFTTKYINAAGILAFNVTNNKMTTITGCYNAGDISATLTTTKTDKTDIFAGGIGGRTHKQTVSDCYNTGNVFAGNANGSLGYAGGIVGRNSTGSYVQRCYSAGAISGAHPGAVVGLAMAGSNTRATYWLSGAAATGIAEGTGATTARTAEEMTKEPSFSGFSFVQTWAFKPAENSNYPVLRAFHPGLVYTPQATVPGPSRDFLAAIEPPLETAYPIGTLEELQKIGALENGLPLSWDYYLTDNIDLTGDWTPIGTSSRPFTGSFDGQGYVLRNLHISREIEHAGLFGYLGGSGTRPAIKNLALENVLINTTAPSLSTCAGGLVGYSYRAVTTISNCYVTGSVTTAAQTAIAGGILAGSSEGSVTVSDCYNGATVTAKFRKSNSTGETYAGGIIGRSSDAKSITNCHNTGAVAIEAVLLCAAAGIAGSLPQNNKIIAQCSNTGTVHAKGTGGSAICAAGIVGFNFSGLSTDMSSITNSWNTGNISAVLDATSTSPLVFAGGIGGRTSELAVSDCYNTGNISATSTNHQSGTAAGILGRSSTESSVRRCYNTGNITASQQPGAIIGLAVEGSFAWACYWSSDAVQVQDSRTLTAAQKKGVGSGEDTTTPRTAEQLKQEPSFDHLFSFLDTWGFKDGENSGYPVLRVAHPSLPYVSTVSAPQPERIFTVPASEIEKPAEGSIPISTREELDDIRSSDEKMAGKYHLTADIDMSGLDWEPIGSYTNSNNTVPFTGVLDGQGHVLTGLTTLAYKNSTLERFGGLFAHVAGTAVIKNLGLEDVCIYTTGWDSWSGALCASTAGSVQITNCYATGQANAGSTEETYGASIGGLVGHNGSGSLELIDCHSSVVLTAKSDDALFAGGICGRINNGRLYNCQNTGNITATRLASASAGHPRAGGLTSYISGSAQVVQCSNAGNVSLTTGNSWAYGGGVVGYVGTTGSISASSNTGDVYLSSSTASPTLDAGGVVGYNVGKVSNSYNRADVKTEIAASAATTDVFSGGVAGINAYSGAQLAQCYSTGSVSGSNPGGVAGKTVANTTITECYWNKQSPHYVNGNLMPETTRKGVFSNSGTGAGTALTTANMVLPGSFTGFDFTGVWNMVSGQNDGYPVLRAKPTPYNVTMKKGNYAGTLTGGGSYAKGETVSITAGASTNTSYRFKEWTASSDKVVFANKNSATTTFTMLGGPVTITANYESIPTFTVTVTGGKASSSGYQVGKTVTVTASSLTGKVFKEWVADGADVVFADKTSNKTTFVMPERRVAVQAVFNDIRYTLTVNGGTAGAATAIYGESVTITAAAPEAGKKFNYWTSSTLSYSAFGDRSAAQTTIKMPASNVAVTAVYTNITKGTQGTPSAPTLAGKTSTTVTLNTIAGAEYRRGTGSWQDSPVFTGLSPGTYYSFSARMKETDTLKASYASSSLSVRTDDGAGTPTPTPTPTPIDPGAPSTEKVEADKNALTEDVITGTNPDKDNVTDNLSLPPTGTNGSGIVWTSSHPDVVSPTGVVTRPAAGQPDAHVTLTATITNGGVSQTVSITLVIKAQETTITGVKLAQSSIRLAKGQKVTIGAVVYYSDGSTSKALTWESDNEQVAKVNQSGRITAAKNLTKNGTTTITATAENGQSAKIKVTVLKKNAKAVKPNKVTIGGAKKSLEVGKTLQLKAKVSPSTATGVALTWKSSKSSVLRVDAGGKLTALKKGTAKITVKAGSKTARVTIKVTEKK